MQNTSHRIRQLAAALLAVCVLLTASSMTAVSAKAKAKAKKTTSKKTTKKTTTKTTLAPKVNRQITVGGTSALRPVPKDFDANGELSLAFAGSPTSLDPAKNSLGTFTNPLYDRLTVVDDSLSIKPMLATGWRYPAKNVFEMTLRSDVIFEDGMPFDASAVKANIIRSQTLPGTQLAPLLRNVTSVDVVSPTVVRFNLSAGGSELPALFAQGAGAMISPRVIAAGYSLDAGTHGGGSGPYVVDSFAPNDRVVYKQSPTVVNGKYWDKAAGLLKKFTEVFVATGGQRINAARSGDIDLSQVTGTDVSSAMQFVDSGELSGRHVTLALTQLVMMMRQSRPPFDNATFRTALQYAVDKAALAKGLYNGFCTPATQFFTKAHWAHSTTIEGLYEYDHDRAQRMIKESGVFNPTFTIKALQLYLAPAQAVAGMLGDYGINAKVELQSPTDTSFRDGDADAAIGTMIGSVDPSNVLNNYYTGVYSLYKDSDGSLARDAAQASDPTLSQEQAAKMFGDIYTKVAKQSVVVHLCNSHQVWLQKDPKKPANANDLLFTFTGNIDARYLYIKK
jgi:ABC-type transport system substrate-binding protein